MSIDNLNQCCFRKCGNDFVKLDSFLLMEGVMFYSGTWTGKKGAGNYVVKLQLNGFADTTPLQYGMLGYDLVARKVSKQYSEVMSPKCPNVLCPATCPLKLSEISLQTQDCF